VGSRHIATGCLAAFVALPLLDVAAELTDQDLVACLLPVALGAGRPGFSPAWGDPLLSRSLSSSTPR